METFVAVVQEMLAAIAVKYNLKEKGLDPAAVPEIVSEAFAEVMSRPRERRGVRRRRRLASARRPVTGRRRRRSARQRAAAGSSCPSSPTRCTRRRRWPRRTPASSPRSCCTARSAPTSSWRRPSPAWCAT